MQQFEAPVSHLCTESTQDTTLFSLYVVDEIIGQSSGVSSLCVKN